MELFLVKPDLIYFQQYNEMMAEWIASGTQIAPWFLNAPFQSIEDFARFVQMLDDCEHGIIDKKYCSTTSYFAVDENDDLIGAASLRHHLTVEGLHTWGHIGYGVRPSRRNKGCATRILELTLAEARTKKLRKVLIGAHTSNIGSCRVIEKCGGILENFVPDPSDPTETIRRYWIQP